MLKTIEEDVKSNGEFDQKDLAEFKLQLEQKRDREQRLAQAQETFNKALLQIRELRCNVNFMMILTQQGNVPQVQITVQE